MDSEFKVITLEMNEICFPRIRFLKSRIRNIIPRMKRILAFEFDQPNQGIKKLRSDTDELQDIENLVKTESLVINVMSNDDTLCKYISPGRLAINQQQNTTSSNLRKVTKKKQTAINPESLKSEVLVIPVDKSQLQDRNHFDAPFLNHAIITVFVNSRTSFQKHTWMTERESNNQFVVMCHGDVDTTTTSSVASGMQQMLPRHQPSSPGSGPSSPVSGPSSSRRTSPKRAPPSPRRAPPSPRRTPSSTRKHSRSRSLHWKSHTAPFINPPISPEGLSLASPTGLSDGGSPKSLSPKGRSPSPMEVSNVKRTKQDTQELMDQTGSPASPMETDETVEISQRSVSDQISVLSTDHGLKKLRESVQFQLELKTVRIIERMVKLLTDVRNRREESARVNNVTILDKLIYEVEGLLSTSNTDNGKLLRDKFENQAINPNLRDELLGIDGLYGCGSFYHRMNIHLKQGETIVRDEVLKKIKHVMSKYQYTEKDYDTLFVRSELSRVGEIVLCSM